MSAFSLRSSSGLSLLSGEVRLMLGPVAVWELSEALDSLLIVNSGIELVWLSVGISKETASRGSRGPILISGPELEDIGMWTVFELL